MRRHRGSLAVPVVLGALLASLLTIGFAGTAVAGGPTSVLLVVPGEGRTASLYTGSPDYTELARLVGAFETPSGSTTPPKGASDQGPSGTDEASGPGVTLTWLMHDVDVWRVDRVYLKAENGPLISTQANTDGTDLWAKPAIWHTVTSGQKELIWLLDRLGVGNAGSGSNVSHQVDQQQPVNNQPAAAAPATSVPGDQPTGRSDGWIWGTAGILLGVVLTLATRSLVVRSQAIRSQAATADESLPPTSNNPPMETLSSH